MDIHIIATPEIKELKNKSLLTKIIKTTTKNMLITLDQKEVKPTIINSHAVRHAINNSNRHVFSELCLRLIF